MMPDFRCEVALSTIAALYNRADKAQERAVEISALNELVEELRRDVTRLNGQVASKDDEIAALKHAIEAVNCAKRHTLTDIELATISELRKMADEKKIPVGAKARAVLLNAAKFISEKGDI